jgi:hypothetical protein
LEKIVAWTLTAAIALVCVSACFDRAYGPIIRNDFEKPILISASFANAPTFEVVLNPRQTFLQRKASRSLKALILYDEGHTEIQRWNDTEIGGFGECRENCMPIVGPSGLRVERK